MGACTSRSPLRSRAQARSRALDKSLQIERTRQHPFVRAFSVLFFETHGCSLERFLDAAAAVGEPVQHLSKRELYTTSRDHKSGVNQLVVRFPSRNGNDDSCANPALRLLHVRTKGRDKRRWLHRFDDLNIFVFCVSAALRHHYIRDEAVDVICESQAVVSPKLAHLIMDFAGDNLLGERVSEFQQLAKHLEQHWWCIVLFIGIEELESDLMYTGDVSKVFPRFQGENHVLHAIKCFSITFQQAHEAVSKDTNHVFFLSADSKDPDGVLRVMKRLNDLCWRTVL